MKNLTYAYRKALAEIAMGMDDLMADLEDIRDEAQECLDENSDITIKQEGNELLVIRPTDDKEDRSLHGLTRALLFNMVEGVTNGYSKKLEIVGVGYKVIKQGKTLQLFLGHSLMPNSGLPQARFCMTEEDGITFEVPDSNTIIVKGIDKQKVGQTAAVIRGKRPPEPYHGKGVKYADEYVRRKAGKAGKGK